MYTIFLTGALETEVLVTQVEHFPSTSPLPTPTCDSCRRRKSLVKNQRSENPTKSTPVPFAKPT